MQAIELLRAQKEEKNPILCDIFSDFYGYCGHYVYRMYCSNPDRLYSTTCYKTQRSVVTICARPGTNEMSWSTMKVSVCGDTAVQLSQIQS
jgi:hypothetical protein